MTCNNNLRDELCMQETPQERKRIFLSDLFFSNPCRSCRFLVMQGLLVGFLSVWVRNVFVFNFLTGFWFDLPNLLDCSILQIPGV